MNGSRTMVNFLRTGVLVLFIAGLTGCAKDSSHLRVQAEQAATIDALNDEIQRLNQELDSLLTSREDLASAKSELEKQLQSELGTGDLSVSMQSRGLVVTVLDRVLFDSGKADLKPGSRQTLDTVANILSEKVSDHLVFVEGHTDNIPIKYSGWKSNWELSTSRATEVVHHFINEEGVDPRRLAATGYGEFHPVAGNESDEGRLKNRRVEIVISPRKMMGSAPVAAPATPAV